MHAVSLRCEHRDDIPCVDDRAPRLSWALESDDDGRRQTAYRLLVAERSEDLAAERGTLWDSGRVASAETVDVAYAGRPLPAGAEIAWSVQVWDDEETPSGWSEPARFRTGPATWTAEWIARDRTHDPAMPVPGTDPDLDPTDFLMRRLPPSPYFRRAFRVDRQVERAVLYATARGVYEFEFNGDRVGDSVLAPGWTDYDRRIEYAAYDVTAHLRDGDNVLGAIVGDGWYCGFVGMNPRRPGNHYGTEPQLLAELHLEHADGTRTVIATDRRWEAARGPLVYSDLLMGERYDGRRELGAWSEPGADRAGWHPVVAEPLDDTLLVPERSQPMRVTEEIRPVSVTEREPGVHVFDLGQNMVGWVRLHVEGERGTRVQLRFAEMLQPDGSLYLENLRSARALDTYVLRGGGPEVFEPRFTFHGFRFVEVTGLPAEPSLDTITGRVVHSDTPRTGWFECSDQMVNRLVRNIEWGQRGNFVSVPTDCPQRDERLGWLADAQVFLPTASLNMDVQAFIRKWGDDVLDGQLPSGAYPDVAPVIAFRREGAPAWADAGIITPWVMWRRYGDRRLVERHWDAMERYMDHLARHNPDLLWTARRGNDYGDWLSVGEHTPRDVLATAYWAYDAQLMAHMARALDLPERAEHYERLRAGIVAAWNRAYVGEDVYIEGDTQTVYLLALHMDLIPHELRARAAERLVENIERHDGHLTTGFVGVGLLCPVLSEAGHSDVAHRLLRKDTFPSWGYSIRHGATTIWERWDGWTEDAGFQTPMMNSFNHYSLGSVGQWLYEYVAGIRAAEPGYRRVVIAPEPGELAWARATYKSVRGPITSDWRRTEDGFRLEVEIPPNVTATVVVPGGETVEVGPGRHAFTSAGSRPEPSAHGGAEEG
ncbi:MAG TPA: glycoside hydrolase family 78 protein [Solirubrobacteraceae bacterium]|nr:glycoside hydrolase family 78 protein [Solirubrobacteraceae bacterium]